MASSPEDLGIESNGTSKSGDVVGAFLNKKTDYKSVLQKKKKFTFSLSRADSWLPFIQPRIIARFYF